MRFSGKISELLRFSSAKTRVSSKADWNRRDFIAVSSVAAAAATRLGAQPREGKAKGPVPPERQRYMIHPAVGVARLGNSPTSFYLEPITIGGMPIECDSNGNPTMENGKPVFVKHCKEGGRVRRQGAQFSIYVQDSNDPSDPGREITLDDPSVESIEWTVHLANKKSVWYNNQGFIGNVYLAGQPGAETTNANYYWSPDDDDTPSGVPSLRNSDVTGHADRQKELIIDPGPRTVKAPGEKGRFSRDSKPP